LDRFSAIDICVGSCSSIFLASSLAIPIATTPSLHLPQSFFARPAELVAPELIGCLLVKRQADAALLWGVIAEARKNSDFRPQCLRADQALKEKNQVFP